MGLPNLCLVAVAAGLHRGCIHFATVIYLINLYKLVWVARLQGSQGGV